MKKDTPKIDIHTAEGRRTTIRQPTFPTTDVDVPNDPGYVPMVTSFFAWDVLDEFGETDQVSIQDRVDRFSKAIWNRVRAESIIKLKVKPQIKFRSTLRPSTNIRWLRHWFRTFDCYSYSMSRWGNIQPRALSICIGGLFTKLSK